MGPRAFEGLTNAVGKSSAVATRALVLNYYQLEQAPQQEFGYIPRIQ
jgi:hypothetical protein